MSHDVVKLSLLSELSSYIQNVYTWAKLFKEGRNIIQDEYKPGCPKMASTPEIVDSVHAVI